MMMIRTPRSQSLALLLLAVHSSTAFWASLPERPSQLVVRNMAPLSHDEILARAAQHKEAMEQEMGPPPPLLFDEDMLADMQAALLLLEKRVQEGPLTVSEVDQLEQQLTKIREEMRVNEDKKPERPPPKTTTPLADTPTASEESSSETIGAAPKVIDMDTPSEDEKYEVYTGTMGQAAGTKNTYIIPGMDDMTSDEYRAALQQSLIDRQQRRKDSGVTGNRATWDYLKQLQYPVDGAMEK